MKFKLYYFIHFSLIFIISITSTINSFLDYKNFNKEKIVILNHTIKKLLHNPIHHLYAIFTGTNTGYGFYGINVSTYKYFSVELYDKNKKTTKKNVTTQVF